MGQGVKSVSVKHRTYIKQRGNSTTSYYRLIYPGSGSYAMLHTVKDQHVIHRKDIVVRCKFGNIDDKQYAEENGFILLEGGNE